MKTSKMLTFLVTVLAGAMVFTMSACEAEVETIGGANFGAPAGLTVTGATTDSISLGWNPAEGATSYKVYNSASEDGDFSEAGISDAASFTNEGLAPNTICWYKVSSINGSGESVPSPAVKGVTKSTASGGGNGSGEGGEIAAPTGLLFSGVSVNSVTLSWDVFEGAAGYKIYRSGTANGVYTQAATSDANSYTDSGLALNSTYYYKVSALVSPSGESGLSTAVGWKTGGAGGSGGTGGGGSALPAAPSGLRVTGVTVASITLAWEPVTGAVFYRIYRASSASGNYTQVVTSEVIPCSNYGLASSTIYYYKVCAVNGNGEESPLSAEAAGTTSSQPSAGGSGWNYK